MENNKKIVLATPTMHGDEMKFVQEAFDKNWIAPLGFNCDSFEEEMNEYLCKDGGKNQHILCRYCHGFYFLRAMSMAPTVQASSNTLITSNGSM